MNKTLMKAQKYSWIKKNENTSRCESKIGIKKQNPNKNRMKMQPLESQNKK